jgi:hypothetical protein
MSCKKKKKTPEIMITFSFTQKHMQASTRLDILLLRLLPFPLLQDAQNRFALFLVQLAQDPFARRFSAVSIFAFVSLAAPQLQWLLLLLHFLETVPLFRLPLQPPRLGRLGPLGLLVAPPHICGHVPQRAHGGVARRQVDLRGQQQQIAVVGQVHHGGAQLPQQRLHGGRVASLAAWQSRSCPCLPVATGRAGGAFSFSFSVQQDLCVLAGFFRRLPERPRGVSGLGTRGGGRFGGPMGQRPAIQAKPLRKIPNGLPSSLRGSLFQRRGAADGEISANFFRVFLCLFPEPQNVAYRRPYFAGALSAWSLLPCA